MFRCRYAGLLIFLFLIILFFAVSSALLKQQDYKDQAGNQKQPEHRAVTIILLRNSNRCLIFCVILFRFRDCDFFCLGFTIDFSCRCSRFLIGFRFLASRNMGQLISVRILVGLGFPGGFRFPASRNMGQLISVSLLPGTCVS